MKALILTSLYAAILGMFIGLIYDVFRILRIVSGVSPGSLISKRKTVFGNRMPDIFSRRRGKVFSSLFVAVTDVLFFSVSSVAFVLFLYCFNYGRFRWFILVFTVAGFRLYYLTVGKAVISSSGLICDLIKLVMNALLYLILLPLRMFFRLITLILRKTFIPFVTRIGLTIDKCRLKRYTLKCTEELKDIINEWVNV